MVKTHNPNRRMGVNQPMGFKMSMTKNTSPAVHDNKSDVIRKLGGCGNCPWVETEQCPHYPGVSKTRPHSNGACSKFKMFVKEVCSENYVGLTKQKQYLELIKDLMVKDRLFDKWKSKPDEIPPELLDWSKHVMESFSKIRKQEEGNKLNITRKDLSPSDVLNAIRKAEGEVVDVVVEEETIIDEDTITEEEAKSFEKPWKDE